MNLKKYIKLKEKPQEEPLTEEEEQLFNSLVKQLESESADGVSVKKRINLWQILTPLISVVGAIAIILTCVFTLNNDDNFKYNDELIESRAASFAEMQGDIKSFNIINIETSLNQIFLYYDSESNDKLYYHTFADIKDSTIDLVIVINEKYNYKFEINGETVSKELSDYKVTYISESSRGKPQITYRGWIKVQTETVYFEYVQTPALGDEAFFESIQQIIKLK